MQPTATTAQLCQTFQTQFGEIKRLLGQIPPDIVETYMQNPNAVDQKLIDDLFKAAELRNALMQEYLPRAKYLLMKWAADLKWPVERDSLEFDDDGRVVFTALINAENATYFPSLIKKVIGTIYIQTQNTDVPIDYLEEVEGSLTIKNSAVSSMRRLRKAKYIDAENSRVSDIGMLEEAEGFVASDCKNLTNVQSLRKVGSDFDARGTNISALPNLETVGGDFSISGPFVSAPKLREIGHQYLGTGFGELRIENTRVINFRKSFPNLRKVGRSNSLGNVSIFLSENQHFLAPQIKNLKDKGELDYPGAIMVGGIIYRLWGLPAK